MGEGVVEEEDQNHQDHQGDEDDGGRVGHLGSRGPGHLAQLRSHLAEELGHPGRGTQLGLGSAIRIRARRSRGVERGRRAVWLDLALIHALHFSVHGVVRLSTDSWWQGRRDSNPQPPVLETGALPIELLPYGALSCSYILCVGLILECRPPCRGDGWPDSYPTRYSAAARHDGRQEEEPAGAEDRSSR